MSKELSEMKVLFLARKFPPSKGGMEKFAYDLSNALSKKVALVKITWGGSNKWLGLVLIYFFIKSSIMLTFDKKIKVLHVQDGLQAPLGWLLSKIFRMPYIVVAHGLDVTYSNWLYKVLVLPFIKRADKVVSISRATNDEVLNIGTAIDKAVVITIGIEKNNDTVFDSDTILDSATLKKIAHKKILLTTGRLVRRKGVYWFIDKVFCELIKEREDLLYVVVGDGEDRNRIKKLISTKKLTNNVLLLGKVSDEVKEALYQKSCLFIMPNIRVRGDMEGFGIVAIEAASKGLPVIASDLEGIKDAIKNHKNGLLVEPEDSVAFKKMIEKYIGDDKLRLIFSDKSKKFTNENYSWERIAGMYLEQYEGVL